MQPTFPQEIIEAAIAYHGRQIKVKTPRSEAFLVGEIFGANEYALLPTVSHSGPLKMFDAGANVGLFAVYMKLKYPGSIIHCFEPSPNTLPLCRANTESLGGVIVHPYGLYNQEQEATFYCHPHHTLQDSIKVSATAAYTTTIQLKDAGAVFDANLPEKHLDVLKVDTEGCEIEILESLGHRLDWIDYALVEYHSEYERRRIDELLKDFHLFGFRVVRPGMGITRYVHSRLLPT